MGTKRIVVVAFEDAQLLDVVGPLEVFHAAAELAAHRGGERAYTLELASPRGGPIRGSSGVVLVTDRSLGRLRGAIDTLVVAGGFGTRALAQDAAFLRTLARVARRARRVASVCTGAWLLAAAGLLDGKRATTHWAWCDRMRARFPRVDVEPDAIFVRDGRVWTSAGVTAGMDLALALVEDDLGRELSLEVARWLVMFVRRPGGQSQFSAQLASQLAERDTLRELQQHVLENVASDLSVARLAKRAAMSPRHFARVFRSEVGVTPAVFVERARVEVARRLLETTRLDLPRVAQATGFGSDQTLRRAFARQLGVAPTQYRARFAGG
ncbi:MAG: DJ-1/PfpI family protein [Sandaracinaceae bacterium]|nr:DJ-1/PfpI family protein [Sandaracinaceae bacterium]